MISFALGGLFLLSSCGLDEVLYLDEPTVRLNDHNNNYSSSVNNIDPSVNYVEFKTKSNTSYAFFEGTAVYYKIYNNISTLSSHKSNISAMISSSKSGNTSTTTLINSYKYQPLAFFPYTTRLGSSVLINESDSNNNATIEIRLYDEGSFKAGIKIGDEVLKDASGNPIVPCRVGGKQNGFDFFDKNEMAKENNKDSSNLQYGIKPESSDDDCNLSANGDEGGEVYYIKLYAFAAGVDEFYVPQYSKALDLGEIYIRP